MMKNRDRQKKLQSWMVIAVNIVLIVGLALVFVLYDNDYKSKLYNQNVDDIANINQSAANISSSFFGDREAKLRDLALYIENNQLTLEESLDYIYSTNSDESKAFEILGSDSKGFRVEKDASGAYIPVDYSSYYGNICRIVDGNTGGEDSQTLRFASEFTDACTAMKSFALFSYLTLPDENGEPAPYTLLIVAESAYFVDQINLNSGYDELSTVIVNRSGDYILSNSSFKSDNFFQYLYVFNDLTLDEKKAVRSEVLENGKGTLSFRDSRERSCVFVYAEIPGREWFCITAVPVEMFHNRSFDLSFTIIVIVVLLLLLGIDFLYLSSMNRKLRVSVENERIASAAKTDFLSRMSHDIRTPLNVIIGMTLLAGDEDNPPETRKCLGNINESGQFLLGLVNDILDLNKVESGKMELHPEPYMYSEFCRHISGVIEPLCQSKGIHFEMTGGMPDRYVMLDRLRINQIFFNLLSNAVKFTPEGGTIRLNCRARITEENRVAFDFAVQDNGIGMSEEYQQHMFEAFSQEHRRETAAIQGTGLGLAIVQNLVSLMDGTLNVESAPGKGTTFHVHVETCFAEKQPDQVAVQVAGDLLSGRRILLCEDHPLNAQIAIRVLAKKQLTVEHAENGAIGVEMFSASAAGYYDAILMDIRMPVMDGMEATRAIRALDREDAKRVPIIAMTANAYDVDKQNSFDAGMNAHIAKPIDPQLLYETLEKEISQSLK